MRMPNGEEFKTTFWDDFTIADAFGIPAVKDTFKRAFDEWKTDTVYLTELVIVMNMKCWYFYEKGNSALSETYSKLYYKAHHYAQSHLKGEDFEYYFRMTD